MRASLLALAKSLYWVSSIHDGDFLRPRANKSCGGVIGTGLF